MNKPGKTASAKNHLYSHFPVEILPTSSFGKPEVSPFKSHAFSDADFDATLVYTDEPKRQQNLKSDAVFKINNQPLTEKVSAQFT